MTEHKCSCGCKDEKELFDPSTMFFAVLCSCKTQSHNTEHPHSHETRPYPLGNVVETNNEATTSQTN